MVNVLTEINQWKLVASVQPVPARTSLTSLGKWNCQIFSISPLFGNSPPGFFFFGELVEKHWIGPGLTDGGSRDFDSLITRSEGLTMVR